MINKYIKVDKEYMYLLKKWSFCDNGNGYPVACINGKKQYLHQIVMGKNKGFVIDHIDRNKLNNRRSNLRFITQRQNCLNSSLNKNNTSGYKGIIFDKRIKKWCARICPNKKSIHLGSFIFLEDAILKRKQAEKNYGFNP
jgi:hypothetical protein